jgi:hypothetical protein
MATRPEMESTMSKKSPLQRVRDEHGSKAELAQKVIGILTQPEDEDPADFEHRIATMSNRKLLRLWDANQTLESKYGSRDALVDTIVKARFPGGNDDYAGRISGFSVPKLLDLARQHRV